MELRQPYLENKNFTSFLMISLAIHFFFIGWLSILKSQEIKKSVNKIEIIYAQTRSEPKQEDLKSKELKIVQEPKIPKDFDILSQKVETFRPGSSIKDLSKFVGQFEPDKKQMPKIDTLDKQRIVSVPMLKSEKITNPKYLNYNEAIRQKIRQRAYSYIDNPDFQAGQVYLTFILQSNGTLGQVKIIENKTSANEYLKNVGLRSINESNPFPPFPPDLNYPELTFNVIISFEIKE